jgi:adenine-specific DNA methylase
MQLSLLCGIIPERISNYIARQALPMVWDYSEVNPFECNQVVGNHAWTILNVLSHLTQIPPVEVEENENG